MEDQKILNEKQLSWYGNDINRIDYRPVFENRKSLSDKQKKGEVEADNGDGLDVKERLRDRDRVWKKRIQRAKEAAYEEGFKVGRQQGMTETRREMDQEVEALGQMMEQAHREWKQRQEAVNPGLLDLVFDLAEQVVGLPVEHPDIRNKLEEELSSLLHQTNNEVKPVVWISEQDYGYVEELITRYAPELTVRIRTSDQYNPGEFAFDTDKETAVYRFKEILRDFRDKLVLPSWK